MFRKSLLLIPVAVAAAGWAVLTAARRTPGVEVVDFAVTRTATTPAFDARVQPATGARNRTFRIPVTHDTIDIGDGVRYEGWTFGGTVPGPVIRVRQGDHVTVWLVNTSPMQHSIDFHAARIPMNVAFRSIDPGDSLMFEFEARDPGAYMVHCGTPPVLMHIMQGMYLPIIVDPQGGWPGRADKEFVVVQSEFYAAQAQNGHAVMDFEAAQNARASHVVFNGRAGQYVGNPLQVEEGDRVRIFVVNAGPSLRSDFHVVGAIFDRVYVDGNIDRPLRGVQTVTVPTGGGAVFETSFVRGLSGEGMYAFVTHAFADASKGAVGMIRVGQPQVAAMGH